MGGYPFHDAILIVPSKLFFVWYAVIYLPDGNLCYFGTNRCELQVNSVWAVLNA